MSRKPRRALPAVPLAALLAVLTLALGGCGGGDGGGDVADDPAPSTSSEAPSTPSTPATPSPTNTGPLPPDATKGPDQVETVTVEGRVSTGVEPGCTLLEGGGRLYLLLGSGVSDLAEGEVVRVTGTADPGTMTTCQQGTPLRVTSLEVVS